jgi:hypothetical protein
MSQEEVKDPRIERAFYTTIDPTIEFPPGKHEMPVLTSLLHRVCGNDPAKFEEAIRLIELLIKNALAPKPELNTLVVIGDLGYRTVYFNIPRDEAIKRFVVEEIPNTTEADLEKITRIDEYTFVDKLSAYDVWGDPK